ncbi:helix-turn-helix domain-containing protein [Candidatus Bathyarchaeota archaeon]|nr:helix-turn-helix domain-containing protein [Candidatus Bathyarchaeota archaeon]
MRERQYTVEVKPEIKVVEVNFISSVNFSLIEDALNSLRNYIAEDYKIKLIGYINKESNYLRAFMLALSLFDKQDRIIIKNKARFSRSDRRKRMRKARELRKKGYSVKQIANDLDIPLKTVYRWLNKQV